MSHPGTVTLAWIHSAEVAHEWATCLRHLRIADLAGPKRTNHRFGELWNRCSEGHPSDSRADARNATIRRWLDECDVEWLLWLDTDQMVPMTLIDDLLASADPVERPIVGALYFGLMDAGGALLGGRRMTIIPHVYDMSTLGNDVFQVRSRYERDALIECAATGSGCILIHRSVFEKIEATFGPVWYKQAPNPIKQKVMGEDMSFCLRARECGFKIHVDTRIKTSHAKGGVMYLDEELYLAQFSKSAPPPATDLVDVIVPVLHRPQNVKPLMDSLRASTGLARVWFVVDVDDTDEYAEVMRHAGVGLLHSGTFAQKVNYAVRHLNHPNVPWVFLCGDDVRFHPGWLDHALATAAATGAHVIGTNDLDNAAVLRGEHATHMLIRRSYIEEVGASWGGPGKVCDEGYSHWFVDDEIVTAAKERGVWAPCLSSIVEHMHPDAGKAPMDEVYEKGRANTEADGRRFYRRVLTYAPGSIAMGGSLHHRVRPGPAGSERP